MPKLKETDTETSNFYKNEKLTPETVREGLLYTITDEGEFFEGIGKDGTYRFFVISVSAGDNDWSVKLNKQSLAKVSKAFGDDTAKWVNKKILFSVIKSKFTYLLASPVEEPKK